jgi:hypothetical protein
VGIDPVMVLHLRFALNILHYIDGQMRIVYHESIKNPMYIMMLRKINSLISKYHICKGFHRCFN